MGLFKKKKQETDPMDDAELKTNLKYLAATKLIEQKEITLEDLPRIQAEFENIFEVNDIGYELMALFRVIKDDRVFWFSFQGSTKELERISEEQFRSEAKKMLKLQIAYRAVTSSQGEQNRESFKKQENETDQMNNSILKANLLDRALYVLLDQKEIKWEELPGIQVEFGYALKIKDHGLEALFKVIKDDRVFYFAFQVKTLRFITINEEQFQAVTKKMLKDHLGRE